MPPAGSELTVPESERPYTHALDRVAAGIGIYLVRENKLRKVFLLNLFSQRILLILFRFMPLCYIKYDQYYSLTQHFNSCHPMLHVSVLRTIIRHYFTKK
jgi:hypothetical protein